MNILLLSNSDLASNYALNLLLPRLQKHRLKLLLSSSVGGSNERDPLLERLKFFEQDLFNQLVFPLVNRRGGAGMVGFDGLSSLLVEDVAIENAINSPEALARIENFGPELVISIRYGGILKDAIIGLPDKGVINLHSGRLPEYRGVMATFWAMLAGDSELGTTLHTIDDGSIDTGRVIATTRKPLDKDKSYLGNVLNLYPAAVERIVEAVAQLTRGEGLHCQQQEQGGHYYSFPSNEHFKQFSDRGYELFNTQELLSFAREHYLGHE